MQSVNPNLNQRNLQMLENEVSNYLTDSDIDNPKYTPIHTKQTTDIAFITNENVIPTHQRINSLKLDQNFKSTATLNANANLSLNLRDKDNEINLFKTEIFKLQESLHAKNIIIQEFENLMNVTKARFNQFEEVNQSLTLENENLQSQLKDYEGAVTDYKRQLEAIESNQKSIKLYEATLSDMQSDFGEKEAKLEKRYQEREGGIRKECMAEIGQLNKELEEIKIENEKLKYDLSIYKVKSNDLQMQIEDKECEYTIDSNKKTKEIAKLNENIKCLTDQLNQLEHNANQRININENDIILVKDNANSLLIQSNEKNEQISSLEIAIMNHRQEIEMLINEIKETTSQCENKDIIIDQMRNQNDQLYKELSARENEMIEYDKLKQKEINDYSTQLTDLIREKNHIETERAELVDNLTQANAQLRKMNDLITDKYSPLENSLYKQIMKTENMEKKYKSIIKELKMNEKSFRKENKSIRELLQTKGDYAHNQSQGQGPFATQIKGDIKNTSLYYYNTNKSLTGNNTSRNIDHSMSVANYNYNTYGSNMNIVNSSKIEDYHIEDGQKKTLDEFKQLLNKIDEKLDLPIKNSH